MEIKEKNGKFYVLGAPELLVFRTKEEAEKAAGIIPVVEVNDGKEETHHEEKGLSPEEGGSEWLQ